MKESKTNQELSGRAGTPDGKPGTPDGKPGSPDGKPGPPDGKPGGASRQRDPWTKLQSQLGLLSSPIEQDQVSVVHVVDPSENNPRNQETSAEVLENNVPASRQAALPDGIPTETVAVNILMPTTAEKRSEQDAESDPFGFDAIGDCDIPKNAFASPRKSKAFRKTEALVEMPKQDTSDTSKKQDLTPASNAEPDSGETRMDPLLSDELPISLWQPRKPASVAKPPASTAVSSFSSETLNKAEGKKQEENHASRNAAPPPADNLTKHSFGKQRHERGDGRQQQEKFFDRRSREPMPDVPERDLREPPPMGPDRPRHRPPRAAAPQPTFNDFTRDELGDAPAESSFGELAWEPKPTSKVRGHEPRKSFRQADVTSFAEREAGPKGFGANLDEEAIRPATVRGHDHENDWLDDSIEIEQASPRTKQHRPRQPISEKPEKRREKFDKDAKNAYEAERILARRAREEQHVREEREESSPRSSAAPKRAEAPMKEKAAVATQKIAVSSWDDAVRDIIEKNMQRRPATSGNKTDRDRRNNGGRSHRRST